MAGEDNGGLSWKWVALGVAGCVFTLAAGWAGHVELWLAELQAKQADSRERLHALEQRVVDNLLLLERVEALVKDSNKMLREHLLKPP